MLAALSVLFLAAAGLPPLRWGGDAEGGAPFVEADPGDPSKVRGFDVEVAEEIARALGRRAEFVQVAFNSIDQSVQRGDFDIGMSGVEDTPARRAAMGTTVPYYEFQEVLTVRSADRQRFRTLADLRGHRVGTLAATIAYEYLKNQPVALISYDDDVHPYSDLREGRLDAVLLDNVIAARSMRRIGGLYTQPQSVTTGHYIIVLSRENTALRDRINHILKARMRDGTLERIYRKWDIWDSYQPAFFARVSVGTGFSRSEPAKAGPHTQADLTTFIQRVQKSQPLIGGYLANAKSSRNSGDRLVFTFSDTYYAEAVSEARDVLQEIAADVMACR